MSNYGNYDEYELDFCEYDPRSVNKSLELENELINLALSVEAPKLEFFKNFLKKYSHQAN